MPPARLIKNGSGKRRVGMTDAERRERRRFLRFTRPKRVHRRTEALRRLGVSEAELARVPDISSVLKLGQGGLTQTLKALRFSAVPCAVAFLARYDRLPKCDRRYLPWEAIALAAKIDPVTLLGASILAIQAHSANAVKIIALSHHPEVMSKRIKYALLPSGERDRTAIDTALGFLPAAKGRTFILNPLPRLTANQDDDDDRDPNIEEIDINRLFPSLAETQEKLIPEHARMLDVREDDAPRLRDRTIPHEPRLRPNGKIC